MKASISVFILCLPISLLYVPFFWNPVVFDDINFFDGSIHEQYLNTAFSFDLRWLPYATFEWTHALLGLDLVWFRLGNLGFHLAVTLTLFVFFRRLFSLVTPLSHSNSVNLSSNNLALFAALLFAVHPAAVYTVGYLVQRSTLMATLFVILSWCFFLEGLLKKKLSMVVCLCVDLFLSCTIKRACHYGTGCYSCFTGIGR